MYGLIVTAGIFISAWYAEAEMINKKKDPEIVWGALVWVLVLGIIGARLFHVFDLWSYYSQSPILILEVWRGGLGIIGGIIGGILGLAIYSLKNGLKRTELLSLLDLAGASAPLGQAIGRWANYFNQELFGLPTKLPWGIYIPKDLRPGNYYTFTHFQPLFLYESLGSLLIFFLIFILRHKIKSKVKLLDGDVFLIYLSCYGTLRFLLENFRIQSWELGGINVIKTISAIFILFPCLILLLRRIKKNRIRTFLKNT